MSKIAVKVAAAKKGWRSRKRMAQVTEVATVPRETSDMTPHGISSVEIEAAWQRLTAHYPKGDGLGLLGTRGKNESAWDRLKAHPKGEWLCLWPPVDRK